MSPKISVIVPVYKAEKYLHRCVDSILAQTFTDFEVLLIDDGSPDKSGEICDEYAKRDSRVSAFHQENRGVSSARNLGLSYANGIYITFVDSDDWIESTYLKDFAIDSIIDYNILVIQGIKQLHPKWNRVIEMFNYKQEEIDLKLEPDLLYKRGILTNGCPVAKLFSNKILREHKIRFNEEISLNEDHLFCLDYILYVDKIMLRDSINYVYFYDFQVPSLTKIKHSAFESLLAAKALHQSIFCIIRRFSLDDTNDCLSLFGPYQLIRGTFSCFNDINGYKEFFNITKEYIDMTQNRTIVGYDIYSKSFVHFVNRVNVITLYYIQFVLYIYCFILNKLKRCVKIVIPKKPAKLYL